MEIYKFLSGCLTLVAGVTALLSSSCASDPKPVDLNVRPINADAEAKKFNADLVRAIQKADKILIKEHSDKVDFMDLIPEFEPTPYYIYGQKEMNTGEKILFLGDVKKLKGVAKSDETDCLFESHHTIDFYEMGVLKSSMAICYKCGDIEWNGSRYKESKDVFEALTPAIKRAGMQTDRAWDEWAKQRYKRANNVKPPEPNPAPNPDGVPTAKWATGQVGKKVVNPFTGRLVDVEGIPAGTKVRDPNDSDPTHIFRVPKL